MGEPGASFWLASPLLVFALVALAEWIAPRRALLYGRDRRWLTSAGLFAANRAAVWLLARLVAVPAAAYWADMNGIGLLNLFVLPGWIEVVLAFVLLDFAMWLQHLLMHRLPWLWRAHRVHHADPDLDVSTAIRFHPLEIAVSVLWKAAWVILLGIGAPIVIAFEIWLAANAAFNHGNVQLPRRLDRFVRLVLVTPDMHLVHHSTHPGEQQRNYGFALTIWDRLFGTYLAESRFGRDFQPIGVAEMQDFGPTRLGTSLKMPLT